MLQRLSARTKAVRDLVSEVVGFAPYEKRLLDMLKTGGVGAEKKMYKMSKRRVSQFIAVYYPSCFMSFFVSNYSLEATPEL